MKRTQKQSQKPTKLNESSEIDMDCSCEILYDDQLSNVGDSDCDCSDCLSANLNAFNQFKNENQNTLNSTKQKHYKKSNKNQNVTRNKNRQGSLDNKNNRRQSKTQSLIHRNRSSDRFHKGSRQGGKKWGVKADNEQSGSVEFDDFAEGDQYSNGQLNDFMVITKHRTRKYLEQRKKLQNHQKQKKQELKEKIKRNLQMLKYTSEILREDKLPKDPRSQQGQFNHQYKWNHSKYKCQCNGKVNVQQAKENCCRIDCRNTKSKQILDTNLANLNSQFKENKDQFLQNIQKQRKQKQEAEKKQKCQDKCPNHHNRTEKAKILEIQQMIAKNVEKHKQEINRKKKEQKKKQKKVQNKLEALDSKCKEIVRRSKVYDPNVTKSSFRLSIQQFDTFSELREEDERRKQMKKQNMQIKRKLKQNGGELLEKIYQQEDEDNLDDIVDVRRPSKQQLMIKKTKQQYYPQREEQIYKRVAHDAKIMSPKNLKGKAQKSQQKITQSRKFITHQKNKKKQALNKEKEQLQKKRINDEIQKKKKQIMQQFQKRNSNLPPKNTQIGKEYQKKTRPEKHANSKKEQMMTMSRDPYRSNYQTKPMKNQDQIRTHGDPLLQEYTYHKEKQKVQLVNEQGMDVFKGNVHGLTSKKKLLP